MSFSFEMFEIVGLSNNDLYVHTKETVIKYELVSYIS